MLPYPIPRTFIGFLTICVNFYPGLLKRLLNSILLIFFIGFSILSYPIRTYATIIRYTKPYAKPIKFISKLYTNHNTLFVKHATYQKAECLKAAFLSKLDNMVNNNPAFNAECAE